jgi:hypothetical protein
MALSRENVKLVKVKHRYKKKKKEEEDEKEGKKKDWALNKENMTLVHSNR